MPAAPIALGGSVGIVEVKLRVHGGVPMRASECIREDWTNARTVSYSR